MTDDIPLTLISELQKTIETLTNDNRDLTTQLKACRDSIQRLERDAKNAQQQHRTLKAEIITSLRAINLCILATLNTEKQQLTHRARNFRMRHVNQIISNEIDRFADRKLSTYDDDF